MSDTLRVLFVDDDPESVAATTEYLTQQTDDLEPLLETDPEVVMDRLEGETVDCLVSDYKMAGLDGIELLTAVREDYPTLPFIFYTGRGSERVASEAMARDATDYVRKSVDADDFDVLLNRIKSAIARHRERVSYRELFERVGVGMIVFDVETFEWVQVNRTFCDLVGYDRETLQSMDIGEITAGHEEYTSEELTVLFEAAVDEGSLEFEWPFVAADGRHIWSTISLEVATIQGKTRLLATAQDITERKEWEQELQTVTERLDLAVEGANLGVWDWDMDTDRVAVNAQWADILGISPEDLVQTISAWKETIHPDDRERVQEGMDAHHAGKAEFYDFEYRMASGPDEWKWVRTIGRIVGRSDDGEPVRAVGIHMDVDERKRYERRIKQQRDNLETLNEMVRHDIRNDLQLVMTYLEILTDHVNEDGRDYLQTAHESADKATELTETARELSEAMLQADAERFAVPLRGTLHRQIEAVRSTEPNAVITTESDTPLVSVQANDMLASVFRNLLKNAIQHNDADVPEVLTSFDVGEESIVIKFADNGPGIPDEQKEMIFAKGERGLNSQGTGIGLYLVRELVDQYGGDVWVEDNEPTGSVFYVELPLADETDE